MNAIDLRDYAHHSQKIPATQLNHFPKTEPTKLWETLGVHGVDLFICLAATNGVTILFHKSLQHLMVTKGLRYAFAEVAVKGPMLNILPLIILSYFFFNYFMNHGQSLGMMVFKKRIVMRSKSFGEALHWSLSSMFICLSGGIVFLNAQFKDRWNVLTQHDYLYQGLIADRFESVSLDFTEKDHSTIQDIDQAA